MPDLFDAPPRPQAIDRTVGKGNALFLADLAMGTTAATLRANASAGKYPNLNTDLAKANLKFWGLT